ncbi:MAG: hypothetical protein N2Z75_09205 [Meiothermus sp.]|nr:hypothetical protein [Meiothermus sp.]
MEGRLKRLEGFVREQHRKAWQAFIDRQQLDLIPRPAWEAIVERSTGILENKLDATLQAFWPPVDIEGLDLDVWLPFFDRCLEAQHYAEGGDLSLWPDRLPEPPPEPPGLYERVQELVWSSDEDTQVAAALSLWALNCARARKEIGPLP